ncbi:MAG: exodeoxyribonuclease VII small subunit [Oscillospiraceae bacterium]|nr:exodeoxyribonuclease VII small subunit [Oscillospiraceae bacterium]
MTYEQAIKRLEEIVNELEKGGKTLDESVKLFEEGASLAHFCDEALKNAELKITKLTSSEKNDE